MQHPLRRRGAQGHRRQACVQPAARQRRNRCRRRTSCSPSAWKAIRASSARPAKTWSACQYQLDDPKEFRDETILVVGAGDSAIENALALAEQNDVWILNRGKEFSRAKDANLNAVVAAIADPRRRLNCYYEASIKSVAAGAPGAPPLTVVLQTATGEKTVECHRIIARLGAIPPRKFVESIGIKFPNERSDAIPELSRHYESNVPGVYVIGSLAGYPLIKQAMNQGYDVVEFINGNDLKPADHPLLEYQFHGLPFERPVDEMVERFQTLIPMFRQMNGLQFRELIIESDVIVAYPEGAEHEDAKRKMEVLRKQLAAKEPQPRATRIVREGEAIYSAGRVRHFVLHDRRRRSHAGRRGAAAHPHAPRPRRVLRRDEPAVRAGRAPRRRSPARAASWSRRRAGRWSS